VAFLVLLFATLAFADIYLHNPRGSNNRLDDENRDRNNGNRVFDSQNNNRGGYNVGSVYYYEGSLVPVEWTSQHSCGHPNAQCEVVFQYSCDDRIRDGTTTNTIPDSPAQCYNYDCDTDVRYGRHESFESYQMCKYTERNKGLFTANQNLQGDDARYTRQNPNGGRRGLECPEERDYYPYWRPTMWRDIAVLTNQPARCAAYQAESQNVKSRWTCKLPTPMLAQYIEQNRRAFIPVTQEKCEQIVYTNDNGTLTAQWVETPSWNLPAPVCRANQWTRDNHLGNAVGGFPNMFNWTVPAGLNHEQCVFRVRYNISTNDFSRSDVNGLGTDNVNWESAQSVQASAYLFANHSAAKRNPNANNDPARADVWSKFGLTETEAIARDYVFKNNPRVQVFGQGAGEGNIATAQTFQLAINTNQFGRTFQDRSHRFALRARPSNLASARIHNVQVKGKRGNIVQTFPGVEYDFIPNRLEMKKGDYIHFQWTGSNTNPNNNDGQGRQGSDRNNVVPLASAVYDEGGPATSPATSGHWGRSYPAKLTHANFLGWSFEDLVKLALLTPYQLGGEMSELDDAGTYFDFGPKQVNQNGIYHYLCTRNNNFSNRGQKAKIRVTDSESVVDALDWNGGKVAVGGSSVEAAEGALAALTFITVENLPGAATSTMKPDSGIVGVQPKDLGLNEGSRVVVRMSFDRNLLGSATLYRAETLDGEWSKVSGASFSGSTASASVTEGGFYAVQTKTNIGAVVGICIGVLVVLGAAGFAFHRYWWLPRHPKAASTNA